MPVNLSRSPASYKYAPVPALALRRVHPGSREPHVGTSHIFYIDRAGRVVKSRYGVAAGSYWVSSTVESTDRPPLSTSWLNAARADEVVVEDRDFCRPPPSRFPDAAQDYGGPSIDPRVLAASLARQHDEFSDDDYCRPPRQRYGQEGKR